MKSNTEVTIRFDSKFQIFAQHYVLVIVLLMSVCVMYNLTSLACCWFYCRPQLLQVLIGLFELPQDTTAVSDDIPLMDPDADNAGVLSALFN